MNDRIVHGFTVILSILAQSSAAFLLIVRHGPTEIGSDWFSQFSVVTAICVIFSALLFFPWARKWTLQIIIARTVLIFIICTPFVLYPELKFLLLVSLAMETGLLFSFPKNAFLLFLLFIGTFALTRPTKAWDRSYGALVPDDAALFFCVAILLVASFILARFTWDRAVHGEDETKRLRITVRQLTDINLSFQEYAILLKDRSVVEERNRISREIHDSMGYTLTNIRMMLEAAIRIKASDPEKMTELLVNSRTQAVTGLDEIRYVLRALRSLNTAGKSSLLHMIYQITKAFEDATRVTVVVEYADIPWNFSDEVQVFVLRLIQEGMTNAFKHGNATRIDIQFRYADNMLNLTVRDNGLGAMDIKEGIGFQGMKERINALHGEMGMRNVSDGFELSAVIPVNESV
ncbi:MAG: sensor histidine kinase [Treponemataceae bacterium]